MIGCLLSTSLGDRDLLSSEAEFLVLLTGIEETFSQSVHSRSSYKLHEIVWGARFMDIFKRPAGMGPLTVEVSRLHLFELVQEKSDAPPSN